MITPPNESLSSTQGERVSATDYCPPPHEPQNAGVRFAGLSSTRLVFFVFATASLCWAMWVTRALTKPVPDDLVAVSISKLVGDFVSVQARSNAPEDVAAVQTALYMKSLDEVLKARSAKGVTILVSEAVIASSARDITQEIRAETALKMASLLSPTAAPVSAAPVAALTPGGGKQ